MARRARGRWRHDELLAKGGVYARLYRLQFAVEELEKEEAKVTLSAPISLK